MIRAVQRKYAVEYRHGQTWFRLHTLMMISLALVPPENVHSVSEYYPEQSIPSKNSLVEPHVRRAEGHARTNDFFYDLLLRIMFVRLYY